LSSYGTEWDHDVLARSEDEDEDYSALIRKLAVAVVERQLTVPAIVFLESVKPLSFLGNQLLVFLNPFVSLLVSSGNYYAFVRMIEHRENVEKLIEAIEEENARSEERKRKLREERRKKGSLWKRLSGKLRASTRHQKGDRIGRHGHKEDPGD
jgi:hypothetical protein